jgi:alcohol dehydrogenase class IV
MRFEFATANRIIFGSGTLQEVGSLAASLGHHALVVNGQGAADPGRLLEFLAAKGVSGLEFAVAGEPTTDLVREGVLAAKAGSCDFVIGFGGGSCLDTAKAIAAMLANPGDVYDYLEVIGKGKGLSQPSFPIIAIPTTAGTGSEVTRNAVLASPEHRVKVSLRSPSMLPRVALVDPELTYSLPAPITASTGMDALAQLVEPFVSVRANPLVDALCREGMRRSARSLFVAYSSGSDAVAREDMSLASLYGGLALANAGLGAVHGFAAPIGGMFPAPHGAVCARLLAPVIRVNIQALQSRQTESQVLVRYLEVAQILTGSPQAGVKDGMMWVEELVDAMKIPRLGEYGMTDQDISILVEKGAVASSMQANPIKLTPEELRAILQMAL